MRNRGIELFMLPDPYQLTPSPHTTPPPTLPPTPGALLGAEAAGAANAHSLVACELESVMSADGVPGGQPAACLAAAHVQLVQQAAKAHRYTHHRMLCFFDLPLALFYAKLSWSTLWVPWTATWVCRA